MADKLENCFSDLRSTTESLDTEGRPHYFEEVGRAELEVLRQPEATQFYSNLNPTNILDVGCWGGVYLQCLLTNHIAPTANLFGIDRGMYTLHDHPSHHYYERGDVSALSHLDSILNLPLLKKQKDTIWVNKDSPNAVTFYGDYAKYENLGTANSPFRKEFLGSQGFDLISIRRMFKYLSHDADNTKYNWEEIFEKTHELTRSYYIADYNPTHSKHTHVSHLIPQMDEVVAALKKNHFSATTLHGERYYVIFAQK